MMRYAGLAAAVAAAVGLAGSPPAVTGLDHIPIAVRNLDRAAADYQPQAVRQRRRQEDAGSDLLAAAREHTARSFGNKNKRTTESQSSPRRTEKIFS